MDKDLHSKFAAGSGSKEQSKFKEQTIGLVSASDFRTLQQATQNENDDDTNAKNKQSSKEIAAQLKAEKKAKKERKKAKKRLLSTLSFAGDEELNDEDDDDNDNSNNATNITTTKKTRKDPTMDTSFLVDVHRDAAQQARRQQLEREYQQKMETAKGEPLEIVYSYWDGSGHRQTIKVKKGDSIGEFLEQVRQQLVGNRSGSSGSNHFPELRSVAADALLYVKEDLILPHDLSFLDLITIRARGKSGPLFEFGVREDLRMGPLDSRMETDESHPGKVVERRWYERNKHIFPASRWEIFDAGKSYGKYRVGDKTGNDDDKVSI